MDRMWRLHNLYWITDKDGRRVKFSPNWAQEEFLREVHYCNLVLKARQLGFTTFWQLLMLDVCLFNEDIKAGTIAHTLDDAKAIFQAKVKYPYEHLPDGLRDAVPIIRDNTMEMAFGNGSSIRVGTSLRGGTLQYLHVSELGKIAAKYPERAREIRTGALNTIQAGQFVLIESTAEGQDGDFFKMCEVARAKQRRRAKLSKLDFKFFFFPWHREPGYRLDPTDVVIPHEATAYFERLELEHGIVLDAWQRAWWAKKYETQQEDMWREFPSTPDEAFAAAVDGSYYGRHMAAVEKREGVGLYKAQPGFPVQTFHDIGVHDYHSIWFAQFLPGEIRWLAYYQNCGEGLPFYAEYIAEQYRRNGWLRTDESHDWFPHDGKVKEWGTGKTRLEQSVDEGLHPRIPAAMGLGDGINAVRAILKFSTFDAEGCELGITQLKNYRKTWNERTGSWQDQPFHNDASHGADAARTLAVAHRDVFPVEVTEDEKKRLEAIEAREARLRAARERKQDRR